MDKNLYYIVARGTNSRVLDSTGIPLIATAEAADERITPSDPNRKPEYEKIFISEYEERYGTEKPESAVGIPETIVPVLIVRGGSIDDISIKQIGPITHVYRKTQNGARQDVAVITGIHEDLWPQRNYPAPHSINYTNRAKGGRIYFTVKVKGEQEEP